MLQVRTAHVVMQILHLLRYRTRARFSGGRSMTSAPNAQLNLPLRGKPTGAIRPPAPRTARQGVKSLSVRTRPLSPPSAQLSPSLMRIAATSLRPPSR